MGKDANTAGPAARGDTNRRSGTATLFAALWPSLVGPEHGIARRTRKIWRQRLTHVALIAAITGVGALIAAPPFHHPGETDAPHDRGGGAERTHRGPAWAGFDNLSDVSRLLITLRGLHDRGGTTGGSQTVTPYAVDEHAKDAAQSSDDHGLREAWEIGSSYSPTRAHYAGGLGSTFGGFSGGGRANGGGGRGGADPAGSDSDSSSGPSQSDGASLGDSGQQTDPGASGRPKTPDEPPYVVDPDDGPHQQGDPDPQWPEDLRPQTSAPAPSPSAVPEPQTWLMMIGGFAAIGASLRRRRRIGACAIR